MFAPSMYDLPKVMSQSGYTEEAVFDLGITGELVFLVMVPEIGACRVPAMALSHFTVGADEYAADAMPEHYSTGTKSGKWTIKRDRLRILADSWEKWTAKGQALAVASTPQAAPAGEPMTTVAEHSDFRQWKILLKFYNVINGLYPYQQAAREIADAENWTGSKLEELEDRMISDINDGTLPRRCRKTGITVKPNAPGLLTLVTPGDVNAWLDTCGAPYRWTKKPEETSTPANGPVTPAMPTLQPAEVQVTTVLASTPAETEAAPASMKDKLAAIADSPAERRARIDITRERGARRRVIENWPNLEKLHGQRPDAHHVLRYLKMDKDKTQPKLKTVQNILSVLRGAKLIP